RHEEYYQLFAFFDNTVDGDRQDDSPRMPLYEGEQRERVVEILSRLDSLGVEMEPASAALSRRVERVLHPMGWMPAADFDTAVAVMSTGDYVSPLEDGGWVRYEGIQLDGVGALALGYTGRKGAVEVRLD